MRKFLSTYAFLLSKFTLKLALAFLNEVIFQDFYKIKNLRKYEIILTVENENNLLYISHYLYRLLKILVN